MTDRVLIKDLIHIPERVHSGDFVLKLSQGVADAAETVRQYVVTPQLAKCFDDALEFIRSAVEGRTSKACYLHGSFGSGKSHFMAVLNLVLGGNVAARSIRELAEVVHRHNAWTEGRRFLMVPYHMIGEETLDSAILGQYEQHVRRLHPDAPVPAFFLSEKLLGDARDMRNTLGDAAFFAKLGGGGDSDGGGWGDLDTAGGGWDGASFEAAMAQGPHGADRQRLVSDLLKTFYRSYGEVAGVGKGAFVSLDDGLAIMSQHAKGLGYDGVVLFLDELILWLATRAADTQFVATEGSKLSKLVEAGNADRPVPLVSFVARQRDLRELVGESMAGNLQLQFIDTLRYWEARFHRITLEDRNLPVIARRRVLRPVSEAAERTLDEACGKVLGGRGEVVETLLTAEGERDMFRQVYPFSPALVQTLVAVSSVLQRERTALKLMAQLLVDRREDLELGQLIPVGDLFDVIADGDEPFSEAMRYHFENAKKFYRQKMMPLLERQHGVTWQDVDAGTADGAKARNMLNDARLVKTLLLAALVPEEKSLRGMTAGRLAALNHGTVRSPIPGREAHTVLTKVKGWAAEVGEIKVTDDTNPLISVQVTGVDTDPIIDGAKAFDNAGNRRRKIREILFSVLGIEEKTDLLAQNLHPFTFDWRGTRREVSISYENVREMTDDRLAGQPDKWTVVFDFPFDEDGYSPGNDMARVARYRQERGEAQVLAWLPSFLSRQAMADLGRLVIIDELFKGDRFEEHARHLSAADREQARSLLRNQQTQLKHRIQAGIAVAYGIDDSARELVTASIGPNEHIQSLDPMFQPAMPVGADLKAALIALLGRLFEYLSPAHPHFEVEIKPALVKKAWAEVENALRQPDGRGLISDKRLRDEIRAVVDPLKVAQVGSTHLVVSDTWRTHFAQQHAREGGAITVKTLRGWIDQPRRMGLPPLLQNLIILAFAQQTNRIFVQRGAPVAVSLDTLPDDLELREVALPTEDEWKTAVGRSASLFGLTIPTVRNSANVAHLVQELRRVARERRPVVETALKGLAERLSDLGGPQKPDRARTLEACLRLLGLLTADDDAALVRDLAACSIVTSEPAMAQTMARVAALSSVLTGPAWTVLRALPAITDDRRPQAETILRAVREALIADEHVVALQPTVDVQHEAAVALLARISSETPSPQPVPPEPRKPVAPPPPVRPEGRVPEPGQHKDVVAHGGGDALTAEAVRDQLARLEALLVQHPDAVVSMQWTLYLGDKVPS